MNDLTPTFERESGLVVLEGRAAGAAGEAPLIPVAGLSLAFDCADGQLCRAIITARETAGFNTLSGEVEELLDRLIGAEALSVVARVAGSARKASRATRVLSPEPGLAGTLSSLARLDAARATSPIPPGSPWWAAEAAELAERAGLVRRAQTEARQALVKLTDQLEGFGAAVLPEQAARAARRVAALNAGTDTAAAGRLRAALGDFAGQRSGRPGRRLATPPPAPFFDVRAEVERLETDRPRVPALHWMLDPCWAPEGIFQPGLSPYSDLFVQCEGAAGRITAAALLAPGGDCDVLSGYQVRLVDPSIRRVLAQAGFTVTRSRAWAELRPKFPLDELPEGWIEVGPATPWPVRGAKARRTRRALRWADAALRAERAPAALASSSARGDWMALAAVAWERCCRDWTAAGDADRAYLAARRRAAIDPGARVPRVPSAAAAELVCQVPVDGPAYLAEILGS